MDINKYIEDKKQLQSAILAYLDQESSNDQENYEKILNLVREQNLSKEKDELSAFFQLISQISANHHRSANFHAKIDKIISIFENEIKENFLNLELFYIFKRNKRVLLYLIQNNLIFMDQNVANVLSKPKFKKLRYIHFFYPELKKYLNNEKLKEAIEKDIAAYNDEQYNQLRLEGENELEVCKLIRNDSVDDFISHVTQNKISLFQPLTTSIFETNTFLIKNDSTLIEYAAFFGSLQIFKYLFTNNSKITPDLWLYAVHGQNMEIIQLLENHPLRPRDHTFITVLDESFKCHNGEVTKYIKEKLVKINKENELSILSLSTKHFDFEFFPNDLNNQYCFCYLCQANYFALVDDLVKLTDKNFKLNTPILSIPIYIILIKQFHSIC